MFKLLNEPSEKGEYIFSGTPIVSNRVSFLLSQKQIRWIIHQVKEYAKKQPRDFILTFRDDVSGDNIFVIDNLTQNDLDELNADSNLSPQQITALAHYSIIYEGELPMT